MTIKLLAMDVDGTMTDGSINISQSGELFKVFNVKDGLGIKIAQEKKLHVAIITGRRSKIVEARASELFVEDVMQGVVNKKEALSLLSKKYDISFSEIAYIGDDINDLEVLNSVGLSFCPSDAVFQVKKVCSVVLSVPGGKGAVRECVDYVLSYNGW